MLQRGVGAFWAQGLFVWVGFVCWCFCWFGLGFLSPEMYDLGKMRQVTETCMWKGTDFPFMGYSNTVCHWIYCHSSLLQYRKPNLLQTEKLYWGTLYLVLQQERFHQSAGILLFPWLTLGGESLSSRGAESKKDPINLTLMLEDFTEGKSPLVHLKHRLKTFWL